MYDLNAAWTRSNDMDGDDYWGLQAHTKRGSIHAWISKDFQFSVNRMRWIITLDISVQEHTIELLDTVPLDTDSDSDPRTEAVERIQNAISAYVAEMLEFNGLVYPTLNISMSQPFITEIPEIKTEQVIQTKTHTVYTRMWSDGSPITPPEGD